MVMTPFHDFFPELAEAETRTVTLLRGVGDLPPDTYAFVELFCTEPGCDCENVMLNVYDRTQRHLATINHSLRPEGAFGGGETENTFLDPLNRQSALARDLMDLFNRSVCRPVYEDRLRRHREMVRAHVDAVDPSLRPSPAPLPAPAPAPSPVRSLPSGSTPAREPPKTSGPGGGRFGREGRNKPCPCGSGRKRKLCCDQGAAPNTPLLAMDAERDPATDPHLAADRGAADRGVAADRGEVIEILQGKGIDTTLERAVPTIGLQLSDQGEVEAVGEVVGVVDGRSVAAVWLAPISALFAGDARPPDFAKGPTLEYVLFFGMIETMAEEFCSGAGVRVRDKEFERLYNHLRRRPDGTHDHPLFSYLQAAARLYMTLRPVSRAEYEAVLRRLTKSARTFAMGPTSSNYLDMALAALPGRGAGP